MNVLPIGTVVRAGGTELMILGYSVYPEAERLVTAYFVVPYPAGFRGAENLGILEFQGVEEILAEGYRTEIEKVFTEALGKAAEKAVNVKTSDWNLLMERLSLPVEIKEG